jgi:thiamine biosynthesis lipoprotein
MTSAYPLIAGAALVAVAPVQAAAHETHRFHAEHVLGTSFDMVVTASADEARFAFVAAQAEIARLDAVLSGWRDDSELARLSRTGGGGVSRDLRAVLAACERWRVQTGGAFDARRDPACGPDVDGLAKGYVIDAALSAARRAAPCASAILIDIGGDLRCWGDRPFRVGIAHPDALEDNAAPAVALSLSDRALAVSGPGLRDRREGGEVRSHLVDPATGKAAPRRQAAVVARTAADADALSTALAVMTPAEGIALAERLPDAEALVFDVDGSVSTTSGWSALACQAAPALPAGFEVTVQYDLPKIPVANYEKPYVVVWVTDAEKALVKTLLIMGDRQDWQEDNYVWWRRYGRKQPDLIEAMAKPTRAPGRYSVGWDGKDQSGKRAPQGRYIVHIEAAREHGGHSYQTVEITLGAADAAGQAAGKDELGPVSVRYAKRK